MRASSFHLLQPIQSVDPFIQVQFNQLAKEPLANKIEAPKPKMLQTLPAHKVVKWANVPLNIRFKIREKRHAIRDFETLRSADVPLCIKVNSFETDPSQ